MQKNLLTTIAVFTLLTGCAASSPATSGAAGITQVDDYLFFQKLPAAVSFMGGVRTKTDEDRRAAVKQAANYAKAHGCRLIALAGTHSDPSTLAEKLRANKLRWNDTRWGAATVSHERAHMVKTPDDRVFAVTQAPEMASGSGVDGKGNMWICLKEKGENTTRPELLVDPNEL